MATYNCGDKVEETLKSILLQNEELFELIVFDGASTDDTVERVSKYKENLTLVSERDDGVFDAFNKAIDLSVGEYLYFIGAGDRLRPGILEQVKKVLPRGPIPFFVYGSSYLVRQEVVWQGREFQFNNFVTGNICHQSIFYHRTIFDLLGKYNAKYKLSADWYLNLECFACPQVEKRFIPLLISDYEEGGLSATLANDKAFVKEFPALIRKHLGFKAYLRRRIFVLNPNLYTAGYDLLGLMYSLLSPLVRKYRHVKRTFMN